MAVTAAEQLQPATAGDLAVSGRSPWGIALVAGFYGGVVDALVSRLMDVIWAFPVYLLAISISTVLLNAPNGLQLGPLHVVASSLWLPTIIIAFIYVPYVFRPVRGHVLS